MYSPSRRRRWRPSRMIAWSSNSRRTLPTKRSARSCWITQVAVGCSVMLQCTISRRPCPVRQPAQARDSHAHKSRSAAAAHLLGKHLPGDAAPENEEDAGQSSSVRNRRPPALRTSPPLREQRRDPRPQPVAHQRRRHVATSLVYNGAISRPVSGCGFVRRSKPRDPQLAKDRHCSWLCLTRRADGCWMTRLRTEVVCQDRCHERRNNGKCTVRELNEVLDHLILEQHKKHVDHNQ